MKLPILRDYDSILVICDIFLKMLYFIVTIEKIMVESLAKSFKNNV